jgi:large subunit ribosomal protein LP0
MLMGKNTLIKAALLKRISQPQQNEPDYEQRIANWKPLPKMEPLMKLLKGNLGVIFTNQDLTEIKDVVDRHAREAPAKVGAVAQCDVWIRAGPTGLDPKQTGFFQNLQIPTKIVKTQIEISADKQIISAGEKIGTNEAALLQKLLINPFSYKLKVAHVFDDGHVHNPAVLDIKADAILAAYKRAISNVAAVGLEAGIPTQASAPHSIMRAFKNLVAVTYETSFTFEAAERAKSAASSAASSAPAAAAAAKAVVQEEPQEEPVEEFVGAADIFAGADDEY